MNQLQDLSATDLPEPLMEVNEMLTMYLNVQRELKLTVCAWDGLVLGHQLQDHPQGGII